MPTGSNAPAEASIMGTTTPTTGVTTKAVTAATGDTPLQDTAATVIRSGVPDSFAALFWVNTFILSLYREGS